MKRLSLTALIIFCAFALVQAAQDTFKQSPYTGKPDNIGQFDKYSSGINDVGRKFKQYTGLATYSTNGRMSKEDKRKLYDLNTVDVKDYGATGSLQTTFGNISSTSNQLTVTSQIDFKAGNGISIAGAAGSGGRLVTTISSINGSVFTLATTASTKVTSAEVLHDDSDAITAADTYLAGTGKSGSIIFPPGHYWANKPITVHNLLVGKYAFRPIDPYYGTLGIGVENGIIASVIGTKEDIQMITMSGRQNIGAAYMGFVGDFNNQVMNLVDIKGTSTDGKLQTNDGFIHACWFGHADKMLTADNLQGWSITSNIFDYGTTLMELNYFKNGNILDNHIIGGHADVDALILEGGSSRNTITGNIISGRTTITNSTHNTITGNTFRTSLGGIGIHIIGNEGDVTGNKIDGNSIISHAEQYMLFDNVTDPVTANDNFLANELDGTTSSSTESLVPIIEFIGTNSNVQIKRNKIVAELAPAYSALTTYAIFDVVSDSGKNYRSKQANNLGHALSDTAWWEDRGYVKTNGIKLSAGSDNNDVHENTYYGQITDAVDESLAAGAGKNNLGRMVKNVTNGGNILSMEGFSANANGPALAMRKSRGNLISPSAAQSGDTIGGFTGRGYAATGWPLTGTAAVLMKTSQTTTDTAYGSEIILATTPNNSTTRADRLKVNNDGVIEILTGGSLKFPDGTTQLTAAVTHNSAGLVNTVQLANGSGGFTSNSAIYRAQVGADQTIRADNFYAGNPGAGGKDLITAYDTAATVNARIPLISQDYIPKAGASAYGASQIYDSGTAIGIGTAIPITNADIYSTTAAPALTIRDEATSATGGGVINLRHSNASDAYAAASDRVGIINFGSRSGGASRNGASIRVFAEETYSGSTTASRIEFLTAPSGSVTPTEKLRIAPSGLVTYSNGGGPPFGSMYTDTSLTVSVASSGVWYEVNTGATDFTAGLLKNVTQSDHYMVATTAGYYEVEACASLGTGVAGHKVALTTAVNGTATSYGHGHTTIANAASTSQVCILNVLSLTAGQEVSLMVQNHSGSVNIDIDHAQAKMVYIGSP